MLRWARRLITWTAIAYPLALLIAIGLLRFVGESWWFTGAALYLPRLLFGLPLLVLVPILLVLRLPKLLWTQLLAALLVLFPLMGLVLPGWSAAGSRPVIRLMSYNVAYCRAGFDAMAAGVFEQNADVVLFQETCLGTESLVQQLQQRYAAVRADGQFLIASRYPLLAVTDPGRFRVGTRDRGKRFLQYDLATPLGPIAFYSVHPQSPRSALYAVRGIGIRSSLRAGSLWQGGSAAEVTKNNYQERSMQLEAATDAARRNPNPVVVCGDTNLPGLSPLLDTNFAGYRDGFVDAGSGFGYTFPSERPWMRIDRIFARPPLRFLSFQTGCGQDSDHHCVVAEFTAPDAP